MTPSATPQATRPHARLGQWLQSLAAIALLAIVSGRCFVAEMPHRVGALEGAPVSGMISPEPSTIAQSDRSEWARSSFATGLLMASLLGAVGLALDRRTPLPPRWMLAGVGVLGAGMALSAVGASDQRTARLVYIEQISLLVAATMASSLLIDPRRRRWAIVALAGVAGGLAAKGYLQLAFDIPDRIAQFEENRARSLVMLGAREGTPRAALVEARIRDAVPTGFGAMANVYASMLLIPAGAVVGLAVGSIRQAIARRRAKHRPNSAGDVDVELLLGVLATLVGIATVLMVVLTGSRGAILAGALSAGGIILAWRLRNRWIRHSRAWTLAAVGVMAGATAGLLVWGALGRIPVKTLAFRRQYWIGAARVWMENLWRGVGGGNFQSAYLHHRLIGAEEAVQLPHNLFFSSVAQFGLFGLVFVAIAVWWAMRPRRAVAAEPDPTSNGSAVGVWAVVAATIGVAALARTVFSDWSGSAAVWIWDAGVPLTGLVGSVWLAGRVSLAWHEDTWARLGVRAGVVAVLVHNLVSYTLWTPGAAGLFWVAGGWLIATGRQEVFEPSEVGRAGRRLRWILPAVVGVLLVFPALEGLQSASVRATGGDAMLRALRTGRSDRAMRLAWDRMKSDPLDPLSAATAARLALMTADRRDEAALARKLAQALQAARLARGRDPANFERAHQLGMILWMHAYPEAFVLNPMARESAAAIRSLEARADGPNRDVLAMHELGAVHAALGRWGSALRWWAKVASLRPRSAQARLNQADAAWMAERPEDALDTWTMLRARRWPDGCLDALSDARDANPTEARLWLDHADLASQCGDVDRTRRWVDRAMELNNAVDATSVYRLSEDQLRRAEMFIRRAGVLARSRETSAVIDP